MKIEKIQALRGPNIWSIRRKKLIQMRLDLEEMENYPTNKIDGFRERIEKLIPSLITHRCSEGVEGGFFHRVETGTWMGHVIEHIALEIQTLAGMDVGFGRTRETKTPGVYNVVFNYLEENAGIYAAEEAVKIAEALVEGKDYDLNACIHKLKEIRKGSVWARLQEVLLRKLLPEEFHGSGWQPILWYSLVMESINSAFRRLLLEKQVLLL